jgi:serine/threonine-protein kinase
LDEALDLPINRRTAWLDTLDPSLSGLKPQLRELLTRAAAIETADFLKTLPKIDNDNDSIIQQSQDRRDELVGPYRLIAELGSGGMGSVWLAKRDDGILNRHIAIKLPHGNWRRADLSQRMEREREILATLAHPNIARLYDAGVTDDGQPYLALEYVEGQAIDQHCREHQLGGAERLQLFQQVARAVAYAHTKLVIHRDLKPSNILVTDSGNVRLLDFGIAKLIDEDAIHDSALTEMSGRALSLEYASPEQILGQALSTATDTYSLGVVLFELLTNARPYKPKQNSRRALEDAIIGDDPPRPSEVVHPQLRKTLRGDLDAIVLKALKKNPEQRFHSVLEMIDDIDRFLEQRPVLARPDSTGYRLSKFLSRHRLTVAAFSAFTLAIVAGAITAVWQAVEASQQRDISIRQQQRADTYSEFMEILIQDNGSAERPLTATELLDHGVEILNKESLMVNSARPYIFYELSRTYLMFGNQTREIELLERSAADAADIGDWELVAAAECSIAWSSMNRNRELAEEKFQAAQQALTKVTHTAEYATLDCLRTEATLLRARGNLSAAIELLEQERKQWPKSESLNSNKSLLLTQLSDFYRVVGRYQDAAVISESILNFLRTKGRSGSLPEIIQINNHAGNLIQMGELAEGGRLQLEALEKIEQLNSPSLTPITFQTNTGVTLLRLGRAQQALNFADVDADATLKAGNGFANALANLLAARALLALNKLDESKSRLEIAESFWRPDPIAYSRLLQETALLRSEQLFAAGDTDNALALVSEKLAAINYPQKKDAPGVDRLLRSAAKFSLQLHHPDQALVFATDALVFSTSLARDPDRSADVGLARLLQAEAQIELGQNSLALSVIQQAIKALHIGFGEDHADTLHAESLRQSLLNSR